MRTYDQPDPEPGSVRSQPWTVAAADAESRYRDFKKNPGLIRTSLEDFVPWAAWPAIERFYGIVEWLNGPDSMLESNDCAFDGPAPSCTPQFAKSLEVTGRLMVLWRHLPRNIPRANTDWLKGVLHRLLNEADADLEFGVVGMTVFPVRYITLPADQLGFQLILSFWAWGDDEEEVMGNLERTVSGIGAALHGAAGEAAAESWAE